MRKKMAEIEKQREKKEKREEKKGKIKNKDEKPIVDRSLAGSKSRDCLSPKNTTNEFAGSN